MDKKLQICHKEDSLVWTRNKFGIIVELPERLIQARYEYGKARGDIWKLTGEVKPITQTEAANMIGISERTYRGVETESNGFDNIHTEKRAIEFINASKPKKKK